MDYVIKIFSSLESIALLTPSSYPSKTRNVKCFYSDQEILEEILKLHSETKQRAPKRVAI